MNDLKIRKRVHKKSKLTSLDPFIDRDGIIRVGGRLKNSSMPQSQQHPMFLPRSSHITGLIILNEHLENKHAGILTTFYAVRRRFWPLDGRSQVRKIIRKCITCFRINPSTAEYLMENLPSIRITQARPFSKVVVDYCGPFYVKEKKFRNQS
ncbi:uncharacterized protein LOC117177089 [Belonocnema kinseyi]|uniref:uncharacterized protein LOC117177089 n=1 Tax=Belonocnema kinseyi TaxID=2817044 RepID=UPI00143DD30D|nr:uncharacterized protein LOC117177089 [Belonocnema kinseyi]